MWFAQVDLFITILRSDLIPEGKTRAQFIVEHMLSMAMHPVSKAPSYYTNPLSA
jgi:hypothetical protein